MARMFEWLGVTWDLLPWAVGAVLDGLLALSLQQAIALLAGLTVLQLLLAHGHQRMLVRRVEALVKAAQPQAASGVSTSDSTPGVALPWSELLELELCWSMLGPFFAPLFAFVRFVRRFAQRRTRASEVTADAPSAASPKTGTDGDVPLLVASLGPAYLETGIVFTALVALAWLFEPVLRMQLGLASGQPVYDTLLLGHAPAAGLFLPISQHHALAIALTGGFFSTLWWTLARLLRVARWRTLSANLYDRRDAAEVLPFWRSWAGAPRLHDTAPSFRRWAVWAGAAALALVLLGMFASQQRPYQIPPFLIALAVVALTSWGLNLLLSGKRVDGEEKSPEAVLAVVPSGKGWPDVLAVLARENVGLRSFAHLAAPRAIASLDHGAGGEGGADDVPAGLTPGLVELLPRSASGDDGPRALTVMQAKVLARLAKIGRLERVEHSSGGPLALGSSEVVDAEAQHPGVIVLAPEASGRSTLALLAAVDHVLDCSRTVLLIVPTKAAAEVADARLRAMLDPSTLRWNVRVRRVAHDLAEDLERGIVPDVIVSDLEGFVHELLESESLFAKVGMVIVDDLDEVSGPRECHAQLAFRRFFVRLRELRGTAVMAKVGAPKVLVLAGDSMHDAETWVRALVSGVSYSQPMRFPGVQPGALGRRVVVGAIGPSDPPPTREQVAIEESATPVHVFHDLADLGPSDADASKRERLRVSDVVSACEQVGVPWHYRKARDGQRGEGRAQLYLPTEPSYFAVDPLDAVVLLIDGPAACVHRERARLPRAGEHVAKSLAVPVVAFLRVVDPDEARAFDALGDPDDDAGHALMLTLPRPVVSLPVGIVRDRHLTAELVPRALEMGSIAEIFGNGPLAKLRHLAQEGLVSVEPFRDVGAGAFVDRVRLRLQARAVAASDDAAVDLARLFPPKPADLDEASVRSVEVRDTSSNVITWRTDAATAHRRYYPRRLFENDRGRFEVTGRVTERGKESASTAAPVAVTPKLRSEASTPRRRTWLRRRGAGAGSLGGLDVSARQRVALGASAVEVETCAVDCETEHVATLHITPDGRAVRNRLIFERSSPERLRGHFRTAGFLLYPCMGSSTDVPLDRDGARLLASVLRVVLRSAYRNAEDSIEVLLQLDEAGEQVEGGPVEPTSVLGMEDAIVLVDAQEGGNGAARAIANDGVEPLFRAACAYLREAELGSEDARWRWLVLNDETAPLTDDALDDLEHVGPGTARDLWDRRAPQVRAWLARRIPRAGEQAAPVAAEPALQASAAAITSPGSEQAAATEPSTVARTEDLGRVVPEGAPEESLVWRRHRWTFQPHVRPRHRAYVVDIAVPDALLDLEAPLASVPSLALSQSDSAASVDAKAPARAQRAATHAASAIALAKPMIDALVVVLKRSLERLRIDDDTEDSERARAVAFVKGLTHPQHLRPHAGPARAPERAIVLALVTGTADRWARTLLEAELRFRLTGRVVLEFDSQGRVSVDDEASKGGKTTVGRWTATLGGAK
jgi:hypothetical protein